MNEVPMDRRHDRLHCRSGRRSALACLLLAAAGRTYATNLRGGILAWAEEIDPEIPTY
ncbi:MAG: hypothetical protein R3E97_14540 [Candidatus Eisenbacteria bacterium]